MLRYPLKVLPIKVIPAAINLLKPADFVQAMAFAIHLESGDKLNNPAWSKNSCGYC
jgi:hypothetical protein